MIQPKQWESWPEYLKRIIPKGEHCGGCQYRVNSNCEIWSWKIKDGKKCGWCVACIKNEDGK